MTTVLRLASLLPVLCVTGCYNGCDSSFAAREGVIAQERDSFVFRAPRDRVFAELRQLLAEEGHSLVDGSSPASRPIETDWRPSSHGGTSRFVTHFIELEKGGLLVQIIGITRDEQGVVHDRVRHHDLEWDLIQRVEPDRAVEIMNRANRRGEDVHRRGIR